MNMKKILAVLLATAACLATFAACDGEDGTEASSTAQSTSETQTQGDPATESTRFDYFNADMTQYVSIDSYTGITVTLDELYKIDGTAVAEYIDYLCEYYATGVKVTDRAVKEGDTVYLYYEGFYMDGTAFVGGSNMTSAEPHALEIGSGSFIPGFEEGLIGLVPSETSKENRYDLHLTFPEDYHNADMAGVEVIFKVYIEYIEEYVKSEYTESFITEVLGFTTEEPDLKAAFEVYLAELLNEQNANAIKSAAWETVLESMTVIKYPEGEIDYYYNSLIKEYKTNMQYFTNYFGYSFKDLGDFVCQYLGLPEGTDWEAETRKESEAMVKQNLAFHYIAQAEGLKVSEEDYNAALDYYVEYYGGQYTAEELETEFGAELIISQSLFDKATAIVVDTAIVEYKDLTPDEE